MKPTSSTLRGLLLVCGGVAFGVAVTALVSWNSKRSGHAALGGSIAAEPEPATGTAMTPQLAAMDLRLRALEARPQGSAPSASKQPPQSTSGTPPAMSPEEEAAAAAKSHDRWVTRYQSEGTDTSWSASAQRSFSSDLERLSAQSGFSVVDVACRTTMCSAEIEFPSVSAMRKSAGTLVTFGYTENCAKEFYHPPADDPSKPYRATLFFDCEQLRAEMQ